MGDIDHSTAYEVNTKQMSIPCLPADLMLMIFGELTTEERDPIGKSCRSFREIDFELGRRFFKEIHIELISTYKTIYITGCTAKSQYTVGVVKKHAQEQYHNHRLFRKATTDFLLLRIDRNKTPSDCADYRYIESFMENIQFKRLKISINCDQASCECLLSLFNNSFIKYNQMLLNFWNTEAESMEDVSRTRSTLMQLPKIDKFKLDWGRQVRNQVYYDYGRLIDDDTLLHIVKNTRHAELGNTNCSAQGILNAFQEICAAKEKCFYIEFETSISSVDTFVRNLGIRGTLNYEVDFYYEDSQSESTLHASVSRATVRGNAVVTMKKELPWKEVIDWYD